MYNCTFVFFVNYIYIDFRSVKKKCWTTRTEHNRTSMISIFSIKMKYRVRYCVYHSKDEYSRHLIFHLGIFGICTYIGQILALTIYYI